PAVRLTRKQAALVCSQILSTAGYRGWKALAIAVVANHVHVVIGVPGDPKPQTLLRDFKSYCARRLNQGLTGKRKRWWTESGSTRKLPDEAAVLAAIRYIENQEHALVIWIRGEELG
ncbi:MAG TPA: transposase, partial [Planctomycetaceae bacterium]|nr:transposase [Planctomycetaceae bacterium]